MRASAEVQALLRCPVCRSGLRQEGQSLICVRDGCGARFPIVDGIPVLINDAASVFSVAEVIAAHRAPPVPKASSIKHFLRRSLPDISDNVQAKANYARFAELLLAQSAAPKVLVVGGGHLGQGMGSLLAHPTIELVETDVRFGTRTIIVCDGHDLPFASGSFDGVVAQAVLEHVVDPYRCAEEIHRVLKGRGLVYAESPFIQQVHLGRYDFTRFTLLGHRRVFRRFEEVASGACCGPGMALAWSYRSFLMSLSDSQAVRGLLFAFASLTGFFLKYLDPWLVQRDSALDGASALYFLGRRNEHTLSDRELLALYRGTDS